MTGDAEEQTESEAWICEDVGSAPFPDDGWSDLIAPARFSVHVERGDEMDVGPEWAPIDEALAWARARAPQVIVRVNDGWRGQHYSAGRVPVVWESGDHEDEDDDGDTPTMLPWPEGGLHLAPRRLGGWEFLDRPGDAPVISWDTLTTITIDPVPDGVETSLPEHLRRAERVTFLDALLELPHRTPPDSQGRFRQYGDAELRVALRIDARTHAEAGAVASRMCADALARVDSVDRTSSRRLELTSDAYPTGSPVARNARIQRS